MEERGNYELFIEELAATKNTATHVTSRSISGRSYHTTRGNGCSSDTSHTRGLGDLSGAFVNFSLKKGNGWDTEQSVICILHHTYIACPRTLVRMGLPLTSFLFHLQFPLILQRASVIFISSLLRREYKRKASSSVNKAKSRLPSALIIKWATVDLLLGTEELILQYACC